MRTNATVDIYKVVKDWKGAVSSSTLLDSYDVWLEHGEVNAFKTYNGQVIKTEIGKGYAILEEDIDLTDCYVLVDEVRYDIVSFDRFEDRRGNFHHLEFVYK